MTRPDPTNRRWLDRYVGSPEPAPDETRAARLQLEAAITREHTPGRRTRRFPGPLRWIAAAATLAAVIVVVVVISPVGTDRAEGALIELARATRNLPADELPPGAYVYVHTEQTVLTDGLVGPANEPRMILYLLPGVTEAWWQDDTVERHATKRPPIFFDSASEQAYYQAGLDRVDGIGETRTETVTGVTDDVTTIDWSTNHDILRTQIDRFIAASQAALPHEVEVFQLTQRILEPQHQPSPQLRAAVIELLNRLPVQVGRNTDGTVTVTIDYQDTPGVLTEQVTFDQTGHITRHKVTLTQPSDDATIPAGTTIEEFTRTPGEIVDQPGVTP